MFHTINPSTLVPCAGPHRLTLDPTGTRNPTATRAPGRGDAGRGFYITPRGNTFMGHGPGG